MPRYFFHLYNSMEVRDDEGIVLPDLGAARARAIAEARTIMTAEMAERGEINLSHWIEVEDERRETALVLQFRDALTIKP